MECPDDNALVAFVTNELDPATRADLISHLDVCETCMTIACAIARGTDTVASGIERSVYVAGERIAGRYRLVSMIGAGAMGSVYVASDAQLGREIAIKLVKSKLPGSNARLSREARAMAQVKHPNVVTVFDAGDFDGGVFIVMELVEGDTLGDWLDKPRGWRDIVRVFEAAGRGLAAAHRAGIVHRDFKPANVLVDRVGRVAVTDFGLAFAPPPESHELSAELAVTSTGTMLGTPLYMSPEAHLGTKVDARADQFSFAVALYHALYRETPFDRESIGGLRSAVLAGEIAARPGGTPVPITIDRAIRRALATEPDARYPTMDPLLDELAAAIRPRRLARYLLAGSAVALVAVAGTLIASGSQSSGAEPVAPSSRVSLVFDHIDNHSREPRFDDAIELAITSALNDSTKLDTYGSGSLAGLAGNLNIAAEAEPVAAALAARDHGRAFVVSGSIEPDGGGFAIRLDIHGSDSLHETAPSLADVLPACTRLAIALRVRFGDYVAAGVQIGTSSIDALHELATGTRLASSGKFIEAALELRKAVAVDPGFGDAHAMLGNVYYNLSKMPEATAEFEAALRDRDRMSERRRLMLMSDYYGTSGRYVESIAASEQYLARWPKDMRSEVSIVATALDGQMFPLALELARRAVADHPDIVVARSNLLLAELATGNIDQVIKDGEAMRHDLPHPSSSGILALGIAYTLRGEAETALHLFESWKTQDRESADAGRADLALYQGRVDDAYKRAHSWLDARAKGGRPLGDSNAELITLARISLRRNDRAAAREFAAPAFANNSPRGKYWVASILLEAGDDTVARQLAEQWHTQPSPDTRVYARLLDGDFARSRGDFHDAIIAYTEAVRTDDSWMAHARLGLAELEAKSYADAVRELELCLARRGEGAIFATPSLSLLPPIYLALAQAKAALHAPDAGEAARRVIALAPTPQDDPLTDAARALASAP